MRVLDRDLARLVIDIFAVCELLFDDVDFGDVVQAARPFAGLEADDASYDLGDALQHHHHAGHRDHCLEVIDLWEPPREIGRYVGTFAYTPRQRSVVVAGIDQRRDSRHEKHYIQHDVERGLHPRLHRAVKKVAADM